MTGEGLCCQVWLSVAWFSRLTLFTDLTVCLWLWLKKKCSWENENNFSDDGQIRSFRQGLETRYKNTRRTDSLPVLSQQQLHNTQLDWAILHFWQQKMLSANSTIAHIYLKVTRRSLGSDSCKLRVTRGCCFISRPGTGSQQQTKPKISFNGAAYRTAVSIVIAGVGFRLIKNW